MNRAIEALQLCVLSTSTLLLGFALCFPLFSFLPLIWSVGLVTAFLIYFVVCLALRRKSAIAVYVMITLAYSFTFAWAIGTFTGVEREEEYACDWNVADGGVVEIDLCPVGGFGRARVVSQELIEHLEKDKPPKVKLLVPIARDFGRVRARGMIVRVDGIEVRGPR
jgi:hypothetical protein